MGKISFNAGNLGEGWFSEGDATFASYKFELSKGSEEYGPAVQFTVGWQPDESDNPSSAWYNVGKPKNICIVDDGASIETIDDDRNYEISKKSAFGKFLAALENAGFPTARLDKEGFSALVGEKFHVEQVPTGTQDKHGKDKTHPLPTKWLSGVVKSGKKDAAKSAAAPAAAKAKAGNGKAKAAAAEEDDDIDVVAAGILDQLLGDEPMTLKELQTAAFRHKDVKTSPQRKELMAKIIDEEFLALELGWTFDAEEGTVVKAE